MEGSSLQSTVPAESDGASAAPPSRWSPPARSPPAAWSPRRHPSSAATPQATGNGTAAAGPAVATPQHLCATPAKKGQMACMSLARTDVAHHLGITPNATPSGYGPTDLQSAYALPSRRLRRRPSPSWTPRTTPTPRRTWARTARSTACRPAPRPTAASRRSTRTAAPTTRPPTPAGPARSRSTWTWSARSARSATSCWSRRPSASMDDLGTAVNQAVTHGREVRLQQLRRQRGLHRHLVGHAVLQPPRRRHHRQLR